MKGLENLAKLMAEALKDSPMQSRVVESSEQFDAVVEEFKAKDFTLGATSNAGLPKGTYRLTFFHSSCFKKPGDPETKYVDGMPVTEFYKDLP